MTERRSRTYWYAGLGIAGAVVAVVAALLLAIIATARSILSNANKILDVAQVIVENTRPIWDLDKTNTVAVQLVEAARSIERHATEVADALETPKVAGR